MSFADDLMPKEEAGDAQSVSKGIEKKDLTHACTPKSCNRGLKAVRVSSSVLDTVQRP